ncbi:MAG TPA: hypothetical protein GXX38_09260, partial [Clostridia bacterium]|nr:hypothetical protein [Clostridia bacterium]
APTPPAGERAEPGRSRLSRPARRKDHRPVSAGCIFPVGGTLWHKWFGAVQLHHSVEVALREEGGHLELAGEDNAALIPIVANSSPFALKFSSAWLISRLNIPEVGS